MKYRTGFVSNSSSSSFMGGIGVIKDFEKFEKWKASLDKSIKGAVSIHNEENDHWREAEEHNGTFSLSMPVNSDPEVVLTKKEIEDNLKNIPIEEQAKQKLLNHESSNIVYFVIGNNEGDNAFMDGWDGLDYDIGLDYFDKDQQRLYKEFGSEESGIVCANKIFGADRNG